MPREEEDSDEEPHEWDREPVVPWHRTTSGWEVGWQSEEWASSSSHGKGSKPRGKPKGKGKGGKAWQGKGRKDTKAKGKDGWSVPELRAPTEADADALAQFCNKCES